MALGSIGSFYFGPITSGAIVDLDVLNIELEVESSNLILDSNYNLKPYNIIINTLSPEVRVYDHINIDFSASPVSGKSPLEVAFTALLEFSKSFTATVTEYRWYFDYENYPTTYVTTTEKSITNTYTGLVNDKFTVRLEVIISPSDGRTIYCEKYEYIVLSANSRRNKINRYINLTNYIPQYYQESDTYYLIKTFEDYLNEMFTGDGGTTIIIDDSGNITYTFEETDDTISVLEKSYRLRELHDPDLIDISNIQYFANYMGYNVNINKDQFGVTEDVDEYVRFMVGNLPNIYKTKTTRNSIKSMLFSFGLIGDLLYYYTKDYDENGKNWDYGDIYFDSTDNKIKENLNRIPNNWYPTSHFAVWYDINKSELNYSFDINKQTQILNGIESVKPANTVFRGIVGQYTVSKEITATCVYKLNKSIKVITTNGDYWN